MQLHASRRIAAWVLSVAGLALAGFFAIHAWIAITARSHAEQAVDRFGGHPVDALLATVDCESCTLADRDHAVWALGQLGKARALPALRRHFTGGPCDHAHTLCQHELRKAIRHLETGWGLPAAMRFLTRTQPNHPSPARNAIPIPRPLSPVTQVLH